MNQVLLTESQKYRLSVGLSQHTSAISSPDRGRLAVALHYTEFQAIPPPLNFNDATCVISL